MWFFCTNREESVILKGDYDDPKISTLSSGGPWLTRSAGYKTKKELIQDAKISLKPCMICGKIFSRNYCNLKDDSNTCFSCEFWNEKLELYKTNKNFLVIKGEAYLNRNQYDKDNRFNGFGGATFTYIRYDDHITVMTRDMWHNGTVPESFRASMPDNATFI